MLPKTAKRKAGNVIERAQRQNGETDEAAEADGTFMLMRELEYRIPRLHYPINSRRFPEIFGDLCKNKTSFL